MGIGVGIGALILVVLLGILAQPKTKTPPENPLILSSIATTTAPWPIELTHLKDRLSADALPALAAEGTTLHIHQHLDIFINGKTISIPAGIGINEGAHFISPIHAHDTTGIIHVESPYKTTFTLGEFFDIWGVRFTSTCLGGYCVDEQHSLRVYSNGELYQGDPRLIPLSSHQEIVIVYGTLTQVPSPIPSSFAFPAGY